ncbi:MAG: glycogen/starch synthase, partial [Candidatus Curtissbacteria bacterium]|nr:glycogen/starch synthase [Candidatus Curtissbacteria bacterium]
MDSKLNVLMVAYEAAPFFKRGGLGDVMESLPKALKNLDVDVRVVIPYYKDIPKAFSQEKIATLTVKFDSSREDVEVYQGENPQGKIKAYFLKNKRYLEGPNVRGKNKRIDEFAFFDLAVGHFIIWLHKNKHWAVKVVHCNDWHTALIPLALNKKLNLNIPTLLTIHNLNYQGRGSLNVLDILQIQDENTKEIKRGKPATEINVLGEGILHATRVTTVSPSYA